MQKNSFNIIRFQPNYANKLKPKIPSLIPSLESVKQEKSEKIARLIKARNTNKSNVPKRIHIVKNESNLYNMLAKQCHILDEPIPPKFKPIPEFTNEEPKRQYNLRNNYKADFSISCG